MNSTTPDPVLVERERCALLTEYYGWNWAAAHTVAKAIRDGRQVEEYMIELLARCRRGEFDETPRG